MKSCQLSVVSCQLSDAGEAVPDPLRGYPGFTPHAPRPTPPVPRHGISLLEVLAAIGVLSVGLLGLAALLPIGRYNIAEAIKGDHAGDCGRAGLRDVIVRRMLDSNYWSASPGASLSFLIDPRGVTYGIKTRFGNNATIVPRISLVSRAANGNATPYTQIAADQVFLWPDDLVFTMPEDMTPPQPEGRPTLMFDTNFTHPPNSKPMATGDYSWFASVVPMPNNPTRFTVSIVVCYKRGPTAASERAVPVTTFFDSGFGGGSIQLNREINDIAGDPPAGIAVKENDWVALCNPKGLCRWYRIASIGDNSEYLTLIGPDWTPTPGKDQLVALGQSVIGVYTTTVELDTDPTWRN